MISCESALTLTWLPLESENAGEGVSYAAPATRDIYEAYLRSDLAAEE